SQAAGNRPTLREQLPAPPPAAQRPARAAALPAVRSLSAAHPEWSGCRCLLARCVDTGWLREDDLYLDLCLISEGLPLAPPARKAWPAPAARMPPHKPGLPGHRDLG